MQRISTIPFLLVCVFGLGSWLALNGIWVELPNLVHELPEQWALASYVTLICQFGNLGTLFYLMLHQFLPKEKLQHWTILVTTCFGGISFIVLSQTWDKQTFILNEYRSLPFFILVLIVSIVDCVSSVTFLPFMAILPDAYLSSLYVGESLTGFVPGIVALIQGSYVDSPVNQTNIITYQDDDSHGLLFSQGVFFVILAVIMFLCPISYLCIKYLPLMKQLHIHTTNETGSDSDVRFSRLNEPGSITSVDYAFQYPDVNKTLLLIAVMVLNTLQNGVVASISSYAYQPYGNLTYHLAASLGAVFGALSCLFYLWIPSRTSKVVYLLTFVYTILCSLILLMALASPNPWLKEKLIGRTLAVMISILSSATVAYTKLSIASILKNCGSNYLLRFGIVIQLGSFIGSVVMFPLVNYTTLFKQY